MIYCLEGASNALDSELREILKNLSLDDAFSFEKGDDKKPQKGAKKEVKKMEDETKGIISKMSKIDINQDDREAEKVMKRAMGQEGEVKKEVRSAVFRAISDLNRVRAGGHDFKEIKRKINRQDISNEEIGYAIRSLEDEGRIHFDPQTEKIYI